MGEVGEGSKSVRWVPKVMQNAMAKVCVGLMCRRWRGYMEEVSARGRESTGKMTYQASRRQVVGRGSRVDCR